MILTAFLLASAVDPARMLAPQHSASLACGQATFTLTSRRWSGQAAPLAPRSQSLALRVGAQHRAVALEPARTVTISGYPVRDRYVLSWACTSGASGRHYVTLGYSCAVERGEAGDCGGEEEWFRYLDERGRAVDAGLPHEGPAIDRLQRRLGIADQARRGVPMANALD